MHNVLVRKPSHTLHKNKRQEKYKNLQSEEHSLQNIKTIP
jgi:hypothetical protein